MVCNTPTAGTEHRKHTSGDWHKFINNEDQIGRGMEAVRDVEVKRTDKHKEVERVRYW